MFEKLYTTESFYLELSSFFNNIIFILAYKETSQLNIYRSRIIIKFDLVFNIFIFMENTIMANFKRDTFETYKTFVPVEVQSQNILLQWPM